MPYLIAFVIIIVAAGALLLFNRPVEAPATQETPETVRVETEAMLPEGYTPPAEQPPSSNSGGEDAAMEVGGEAPADDSISLEVPPEFVSAASETYVAEASYFTPRRKEHDIAVTVELEGSTIVAANVTYDGGPAATPAHSGFDGAYAAEVIGQDINDVELSRTGGASLTSVAFNEAVAEIRAQL
ncbi:MAG: hypothetical protein ACI9SY_000033 [Candidatus Paceibacteria bacterium]|jgi:hypothetical protein